MRLKITVGFGALPLATAFASAPAFMTRVKVTADEALLADYPARWPARIVVETPSGRRELRVDSIPGDPGRLFTRAGVERKFKHFAAPIAGVTMDKLLQSSLAALDASDTLIALMRDLAGIMARAEAT